MKKSKDVKMTELLVESKELDRQIQIYAEDKKITPYSLEILVWKNSYAERFSKKNYRKKSS